MSKFWSRLFRPITTALVIGVAGSSIAQSDPGASSSAAPKAGLAEARKEFDQIKTSREAALVPSAQGPRMSVPELSLPSTVVPPTATKGKKSESSKRSGNWLVEAMEKQNAGRGDKGQGTPGTARNSRDDMRESELDRTDPVSDARSDDTSAAERRIRTEPTERNKEVSSVAVINPLNSFLGDWMTPRDYALLKPGLTSASDTNPAGQAGLVSVPTVGANGSREIADLFPRTPTANDSMIALPPRENPYLASLKTDSPAASLRAGPEGSTPPAAAPVMPARPIMSPPPAQTPAKQPDFAKPVNDDRYFKQLKRF